MATSPAPQPRALETAADAIDLILNAADDDPAIHTVVLFEHPGGGGIAMPLADGDGSPGEAERFAVLVMDAIGFQTRGRVVLASIRTPGPTTVEAPTVEEEDLEAWRRLRETFAWVQSELLDWFVLRGEHVLSLAELTSRTGPWPDPPVSQPPARA